MNDQQVQALLTALQDLPGALRAQGNNGAARHKPIRYESGDPGEWKTWRTHFTTAVGINGWQDARAKQEAKAYMYGEAARAVADIAIGDNQTLAEFLDAYEERFVPAAAGQLARAEFSTSRQGLSETPQAFHTRLRELFIRAYPNRANINGDEQLIEQFTNNLADTSVQMHVLTQNPATYQDALTAAQARYAYQAVVNRNKRGGNAGLHAMGSSMSYPESGTCNAIPTFDPSASAEENFEKVIAAFRKNGEAQRGDHCWFCKDPNHKRNECEEFKKMLRYFAKIFKIPLDGQGRPKRGKWVSQNKKDGNKDRAKVATLEEN